MATVHSERPFLPAAGHDRFLLLYDPLTKLFGFDAARRALLDQAELQSHHRVLDVGCGTGSLAVTIKQRYPAVNVVALDPDPKALARAERKAKRAGVSIRFDQGFAGALGYADDSFDRVFSSMMFHHLPGGEKEHMLSEIRRVLKPGGRFELLDFAEPQSGGHGRLRRLIHSQHQFKDNSSGRILTMMSAAGFNHPMSTGHRGTLFGRIGFYQAQA